MYCKSLCLVTISLCIAFSNAGHLPELVFRRWWQGETLITSLYYGATHAEFGYPLQAIYISDGVSGPLFETEVCLPFVAIDVVIAWAMVSSVARIAPRRKSIAMSASIGLVMLFLMSPYSREGLWYCGGGHFDNLRKACLYIRRLSGIIGTLAFGAILVDCRARLQSKRATVSSAAMGSIPSFTPAVAVAVTVLATLWLATHPFIIYTIDAGAFTGPSGNREVLSLGFPLSFIEAKSVTPISWTLTDVRPGYLAADIIFLFITSIAVFRVAKCANVCDQAGNAFILGSCLVFHAVHLNDQLNSLEPIFHSTQLASDFAFCCYCLALLATTHFVIQGVLLWTLAE